MLKASFILHFIYKISPFIFIFLFPKVFFENFIVCIIIVVFIGVVFNFSKCSKCNSHATKLRDGSFLWWHIPLNCRTCGKSFISEKFDQPCNQTINAKTNNFIIKFFVHFLFFLLYFLILIIFIADQWSRL